MPTQVDIANQALAHLAVGSPIAAMTDPTQNARIMSQFYAQARNEALRDVDWPFATKFLSLTQIAGPSPRASVDWTYSYQYPTDCVRARKLRIQPRRPDVLLARVPFIVAQQAGALVLLTDAPPLAATTDFPALPELEYTVALVESLWPPDFVTAVSQLLAWYASPLLTGGDPHKLGLRAFQEYDRTKRQAFQNNWNEREDDIADPECSFLDARD